MVLEGQYLERATLVNRPVAGGEPVILEGLFHRGTRAPGLVVCAPHPRMGGSMDATVVAELAWAFTRAGHATLRFNYQGVGASGGVVNAAAPGLAEAAGLESIAVEVDDARAAMKHLAESTTHGRIAIAGYSFGAAVALSLALQEPRVPAVVLVAPPTTLFRFDDLARLERPVLVVVGQHDPWTDRALVQRLAEGRGNVTIEVVAGADHTFTRGLTELGKIAVAWFERTTGGR